MKRALTLYPLLVGLGLTAGCGSSSNDALMKDLVGIVDEMAVVLEKAENAKDAKPKLESLVTKYKDLEKRAKAAKGTKAEADALAKKYEPELKKAMERVLTATISLAVKDPIGSQDLAPVFEKIK